MAAFVEASLSTGRVRGDILTNHSVAFFGGIPYGVPPVEALRWRKPHPPVPWSDVLDCTCSRADRRTRPVQSIPKDEEMDEDTGISEDCLFLNIWAPANHWNTDCPRKERSPVLILFHGGGLVCSCMGGAEGYRSGLEYAELHDLVVVGFQYRVGALGFLKVPGGDANCGLWDQVRLLQWVAAEISSFGGDANNVTLFGHSTGADNVICLCCSPPAKGLFHKAIVMSPTSFTITEVQAIELGSEFLHHLGTPCFALEELQKINVSEVLAVQNREVFTLYPANSPGWRGCASTHQSGATVSRGPSSVSSSGLLRVPESSWPLPAIVVDGELLPVRPLDAIAEGRASWLDGIVVGMACSECALGSLAGSEVRCRLEVVRRVKCEVQGIGRLAEATRAGWDCAEQDRIIEDIVRAHEDDEYFNGEVDDTASAAQDVVDRICSNLGSGAQVYLLTERLAHFLPGRIWSYEFTGFDNWSAFHGFELELLVGTLETTTGSPTVRRCWMASWASVAATGDPNSVGMENSWKPFRELGVSLEGAKRSSAHDHEKSFTMLWDGINGWAPQSQSASRGSLKYTAEVFEDLFGFQKPLVVCDECQCSFGAALGSCGKLYMGNWYCCDCWNGWLSNQDFRELSCAGCGDDGRLETQLCIRGQWFCDACWDTWNKDVASRLICAGCGDEIETTETAETVASEQVKWCSACRPGLDIPGAFDPFGPGSERNSQIEYLEEPMPCFMCGRSSNIGAWHAKYSSLNGNASWHSEEERPLIANGYEDLHWCCDQCCRTCFGNARQAGSSAPRIFLEDWEQQGVDQYLQKLDVPQACVRCGALSLHGAFSDGSGSDWSRGSWHCQRCWRARTGKDALFEALIQREGGWSTLAKLLSNRQSDTGATVRTETELQEGRARHKKETGAGRRAIESARTSLTMKLVTHAALSGCKFLKASCRKGITPALKSALTRWVIGWVAEEDAFAGLDARVVATSVLDEVLRPLESANASPQNNGAGAEAIATTVFEEVFQPLEGANASFQNNRRLESNPIEQCSANDFERSLPGTDTRICTQEMWEPGDAASPKSEYRIKSDIEPRLPGTGAVMLKGLGMVPDSRLAQAFSEVVTKLLKRALDRMNAVISEVPSAEMPAKTQPPLKLPVASEDSCLLWENDLEGTPVSKANFVGHAWEAAYSGGQNCIWVVPRPAADVQRVLEEGWFEINGICLELGCGLGYDAIHLAQKGFRVVGVDISQTAIDAAKYEAEAAGVADRTRFLAYDAYDLPVPSEPVAFLWDNTLYQNAQRKLPFDVQFPYTPAQYKSLLLKLTRPGSLVMINFMSEEMAQKQQELVERGIYDMNSMFCEAALDVGWEEPVEIGGLPSWCLLMRRR